MIAFKAPLLKKRGFSFWYSPMASITFQSHSFGRDPMEVYAAKQAREHRHLPAPRRHDVRNSALPELPRRWEDSESRPVRSAARERAEAMFAGKAVETPAQSAARIAAEALFSTL
nr:hypothetical protein HUO10_006436 [Paraburkholderia busanensis]